MTTRGALDGIRVLDLSTTPAGAIAAMLLGDFGADVVAVGSSQGRADNTTGLRFNDPGYLLWDRNKVLTMTEDSDPASPDLELQRLVRRADVVIVDQPESHLSRRGVDATTVASVNPRAVRLWLAPFGHDDHSDQSASTILLAAISGLADAHTATEDVPVLPVVPVLAYEQGALGALNAAAGLIRRQRTGRGGQVTVSGLHSVAAMLSAVFLDAPGIVRPSKSTTTAGPHYRVYRAGDGAYFFLGTLTPPFFLKALDVLDLMDIMVMPEIDGEFTNLFKPENSLAVTERIQARFDAEPRDMLLQRLTEGGVPNAPVLTRDEWMESETLASLGVLRRFNHPDLGEVTMPGLSIHLSRTPASVRSLPGSGQWMSSPDCWINETTASSTQIDTSAHVGDTDAALPLAGLRVLDLGAFIAGPLAPSMLRDLGAEVIKVEMPGGDGYRVYSVPFQAINQSKSSVVIDAKHPQGRRAIHDLVRSVDVVIDNVRPKVRAALGVDAPTLHAINPRLVRCSITGFGTAGALADTPGFDPLIQARSGLMAAQGGDDVPVFSIMPVHDVATATLSAFGALVALLDRERSGAGQEVELSLAGVSVFVQSGEMVRFTGRKAPLIGGRDWQGPSPSQRLYRCRDGWIAVDCGEDISRAVDELSDLIRGQADLGVDDALRRLAGASISAAPVRTKAGIFTDSYLSRNEMFHVIDHPELGACTVARGYSHWPGAASERPRPIGGPGHDSRTILSNAGFELARIEALISAGAVLVLG